MIFLIVTLLFGQFDFEDEHAGHLRMITSVKVAELTQLLELDEHQLVEIIPSVRELEKMRFDFQRKRRKIIKELRLLLKAKSEPEMIKSKIDQYQQLLVDFRKKEESLQKEIVKSLSLRQKAKFFIFQEEFEHRLRTIIHRLKERHYRFKLKE